MKSHLLSGLFAACLLAGPGSAGAGVILQDQTNAAIQIEAYEPIGQSFTAENSSVSFAFFFETFNPGFPNDPLQLQLRNGNGLGGIILGSSTFTLPSLYSGFFDVSFSSVLLSLGQQYTAVLSVPGTSPYFGVDLQQASNPYAGGRAYFTSRDPFNNVPGDDMRFRVTPLSAAVPEPVTLVLLGVGLAAAGFARRAHGR